MNPLLKFKLKVLANTTISPTVFELRFQPNCDFNFDAGQFLQLAMPHPHDATKNLKRSYSIASPPDYKHVELCIKLVEDGLGTPIFKNLKEGDEIDAIGPFGRFIYKTPPERKPFFLATGTGIAPFYAITRANAFLKAKHAHAYCLLGVRHEDEILYDDHFNQVPNLSWVKAVSQPKDPGWPGFRGRITDFLNSMDEDFKWLEYDFYLCGNGAMIKEAKEILAARGVPKQHVFQEIYYA